MYKRASLMRSNPVTLEKGSRRHRETLCLKGQNTKNTCRGKTTMFYEVQVEHIKSRGR